MTRNDTRAFWISAPGRGEIRRETLPARGAGEVLAQTLFGGVSRGTESLVFRGEVPQSEHARMRCPFQVGEFPAPVKYGYSCVARVLEGPPELESRIVFCLHPHQERFVVPQDAVHLLPERVPPARAVLAANLETAINALWDAAPRVGDRIAVIGAGVVGCLCAWLAARIAGCEVEIVDIDAARLSVPRSLGLTVATPRSARADADLVLSASGAPEGLALALRLAGFEARVIELSWYGNRSVALPLGESFHSRRLAIVSSQVGVVAGSQRARWSTQRRMALALALLADPSLDALVNDEGRFEELPQTLARLSTRPGATLMHRVRYD